MDALPAWLLPVLFTGFVWWAGTGIVYFLNQLHPQTHGWSMMGASAVLGGALLALLLTARETGPGGPYHAFLCAVLIWAWAEMGFLTGRIAGVDRRPLPEGTQGWARFTAAVRAILHHELALLVLSALVLGLSWGQPNQVGLWTWAVLYTARLSTKLNLFLGARNFGDAMLPPHLSHLPSYFRRRAMNGFFPVSLLFWAGITWWLFVRALDPATPEFEATGLAMVGALAALAVLEHLFLVLPIRAEALWTWSRRNPHPPVKGMESP
ncbi:MAG: putative photosynthetic complex assembly protein PuhE [Rhodovarius sp.]|nr:putative photosynthetic complex assembly protein PuhE [Rhodovarius sp.]MDW8313552.1 putative photosynthetic complex assembly protein PuhE [Rhodovarius sp.]